MYVVYNIVFFVEEGVCVCGGGGDILKVEIERVKYGGGG